MICAVGWSGAWRCRACPARLADRAKRSRATLVEVLLVCGNGQGRMADVELLVEVREFAPGIFEEEAAADRESSAKQIHREDRQEDEYRCSVGVVQNRSVAGHELQLVEKPKAVGQQDDDGEQQGVRDHREIPGLREGFLTNLSSFWERGESGAKRRPSGGAR